MRDDIDEIVDWQLDKWPIAHFARPMFEIIDDLYAWRFWIPQSGEML